LVQVWDKIGIRYFRDVVNSRYPYNKAENEHNAQSTRRQLITMLRALSDSPFQQAGQANILDTHMPLLEVYISRFLLLVNELVKRGVRSDYIQQRKNSTFLKGRLLMSQQIRNNSFHQERFFIEYQQFQVNRPANRLIKSALLLVSDITHHAKNRRLALELKGVFYEVPSSLDIKSDFQHIKTDRNMSYYKPVLAWCRLLLNGLGPTTSAGEFETLSLLYPMERIFEDYVALCLRKTLRQSFYASPPFQSSRLLKTQSRKFSLVENHEGKTLFNLRPDLLIIENHRTLTVLDTKWKLINEMDRSHKYGISQSDIYQLYASGHKYFKESSVKNVVLIYPKTDTFSQPLPAFIFEQGFTLKVVPFDLERGELVGGI